MTARMARGVPQADGSTAVEPTMDVQNVARSVALMASLPLDANNHEPDGDVHQDALRRQRLIRYGRQRRRSRALPTTAAEENAIAAPAITGLSSPAAASGMPTRL